MRMMMKVTIPTAQGNAAIKDGSLPKAIENLMGSGAVEAGYFTVEDGLRTAFIFLDVADSSQMVMFGEPLFFAFEADVQMTPVMNADDLKKGLGAFMATL